ncbi:aquaporin, Major intrinsic protein family [Ceratobasidium sp. AG-Ba]|nr:aquaporin, Major intrinsic protein family [Ceratobasidium sp. AG-Ba]QRW06044.1 aquaporin, Major intrinsic protein family [Ceratobasidium sp. AG-Ba]
MKTDSHSLFENLGDDLQAAALELVGSIDRFWYASGTPIREVGETEMTHISFCVGTTFWLMLALGGVQTAAWTNQQNPRQAFSILQLIYSSVSMGLSLLVSVWLFFRVRGGLFNPNVTTALLLTGSIGPVRWALYCIAQMIGGIAASALLLGLLPGPLVVAPAPGPGVDSAQAVFIEAFLATALVLAVLMLAVTRQRTKPLAPGLHYLLGNFGERYTGAAMNTARAFGPAVVTGFHKRHWVYWVGPFLGCLAATGLFHFLKHIRYWQLNPDQHSSDFEKSPSDPLEAW